MLKISFCWLFAISDMNYYDFETCERTLSLHSYFFKYKFLLLNEFYIKYKVQQFNYINLKKKYSKLIKYKRCSFFSNLFYIIYIVIQIHGDYYISSINEWSRLRWHSERICVSRIDPSANRRGRPSLSSPHITQII